MNISASHKEKMPRHFFWTLALISGFMAALYASDGQCRDTDQKNAGISEALPIHIESDTMEAFKDNLLVEFSGNVVATQDDLEIRADSIKIFFTGSGSQSEPDTKSPAPEIKEIVAQGRVRCLTAQRQALADKAVYTTKDQALVLTGKKVKLSEGSNQVTGEKLTLLIQQNRVVMESKTSGRVRASFAPANASSTASANGS